MCVLIEITSIYDTSVSFSNHYKWYNETVTLAFSLTTVNGKHVSRGEGQMYLTHKEIPENSDPNVIFSVSKTT